MTATQWEGGCGSQMPSSVPQPPQSTRQLILTFFSVGRGTVADANHQPAQAPASAMAAVHWDKH